MFTNFAMMHGDSLADIWFDMQGIENLIAQVYTYLYITFAICVINNVFIVIIEDGYV